MVNNRDNGKYFTINFTRDIVWIDKFGSFKKVKSTFEVKLEKSLPEFIPLTSLIQVKLLSEEISLLLLVSYILGLY